MSSVKQKPFMFFKISNTELRCHELEKQIQTLEELLAAKNLMVLSENEEKQVKNDLKEVRKLLSKYQDQLDHLKTHDSRPLRFVLGSILVIFTLWMMFILCKNQWKIEENYK
ncbi:hypothetical protein ABEB36_001297 [Hypothenemus hampei]|uniref:Coiled-coil domain-containing protein 167 n=1 Tax=Hypothenemus hampei TaxID=57062 RepID=A0ABD1FE32_HYPHA